MQSLCLHAESRSHGEQLCPRSDVTHHRISYKVFSTCWMYEEDSSKLRQFQARYILFVLRSRWRPQAHLSGPSSSLYWVRPFQSEAADRRHVLCAPIQRVCRQQRGQQNLEIAARKTAITSESYEEKPRRCKQSKLALAIIASTEQAACLDAVNNIVML